MKTILLVSVALMIALPCGGLAQDPTVAVPTEQSEAAAAAVEEESLTPVLKASPSPEREKSTKAKPKASPRATSEKKPTAPSASPKPQGVEATLRDMETRWMAAVAAHDPSVVEPMIADDYAGVSATGQVMNRRVKLAQMKSDNDNYSLAKINKMEVRVYGNAAVVIGTSTQKGKDLRGVAFDRTYRWTDTWVRRNGVWKCVASQSAQVPK